MKNKREIGIILLARMSSTRLPGKVLLPVCGKTILEHITNRLGKVKPCDRLIIATTTNPADDAIESLCRGMNTACFRGSENNVLARCIKASEAYGLDYIIRIGADTPFIDWNVINDMLDIFFSDKYEGTGLEYMSNNIDRSFPLGLDAEIFAKNTFCRIDAETRKLSPEERVLNEINVVPYLHQNLDKFKHVVYTKDFDHSHLRWTLDTPEDYELVKRVYEAIYPKNHDFLMDDILQLIKDNPDLATVNSHIRPRSGYWTAQETEKLKKRIGEGKLP